eukprot:scaffold1311_cov256-Pinguiococcus_pyrenoidosus.AAC.40
MRLWKRQAGTVNLRPLKRLTGAARQNPLSRIATRARACLGSTDSPSGARAPKEASMAQFEKRSLVWVPHAEDVMAPATVMEDFSAGQTGKVLTEDGEERILTPKGDAHRACGAFPRSLEDKTHFADPARTRMRWEEWRKVPLRGGVRSVETARASAAWKARLGGAVVCEKRPKRRTQAD